MKKVFIISALLTASLSSHIFIDDVMPLDEQKRTGVYNLTAEQKQELEKWLNDNFVLANQNFAEPPEEIHKVLTFDLILSGGKYVQLSDGSLYAIAPSDTDKTALWLIPFPIELKDSGDTDFPVLIVNKNTGDSVKARKLSSLPPESAPPPGSQ